MTGYAFLVAFLASLVLAFVRHPRYGMYAYMAAFYAHPPSRWWGATLPDLRWSLLASAVVLLALLRQPRHPDQPPWYSTTPARLLIAFTALVWIQNLVALDIDENMKLSILYSKYLLLYYFLYRLSDSPENIREILFAHIVGCLYLGWVAYGTPVESDRLDGVGGPGINDSNTLGMQFATAAAVGAMFLLVDRSWRAIVTLVALAFTLNGIVLCGSRGAFLAVAVGLASLVFTYPKQYRKKFYVFAALGVAMFGVVASATFWSRMNTMKGAVDENAAPLDNSAESRIYIAKAQVQMFLNHPFGTGHRGTVVLSREYIAEKYLEHVRGQVGGRASHNSFMSALVEQGIFGAAIFIFLILWARKATRESKRLLAETAPITVSYVAAVSAALVVVLIAGLFADFIAVEVTVWLFAILASIHGMARKNALAFAPAPPDPGKGRLAPRAQPQPQREAQAQPRPGAAPSPAMPDGQSVRPARGRAGV